MSMQTYRLTIMLSIALCTGLGLICRLADGGGRALAGQPAQTVPVAGAAAQQQDAAADTDQEGPPQRVILYVSRNKTVNGVVELEEDEVIVVRTEDGELQSFPKSRVLEIVRLVEPRENQEGVVVLRNGRIQEGIILEDAYDHVLMEIEGIRSRLKRQVVHYVILEPTFDERYRAYREAILPNMHQEHFMLCQWLVERRRYDLAELELFELLKYRDSAEARHLLTVVQAQLALGNSAGSDGTGDNGGEPDSGGGANGAATSDPDGESGTVTERDLLPKRILTEEEVNIIRVYEIDFQRPPKISISPDTIRELITSYGTSKLIPSSQTGRTAMFRADPIDLTKLMFDLRARELYDQIDVLSEPYALNKFRQRVHNTWLMNNCATSRCHGGVHAGRFFLHRRRYKDEQVRLTNLLILERLELDPQWPLVNYDDPEMSVIIQHGMPRATARLPHPDVSGWKPVFRPGNERMLRDSIEWIESMMQPRPDYPVEYEPPKLGEPETADGEGSGGDEGGRTPR